MNNYLEMSIIELTNITKIYQRGAEKVYALNNINLEIKKGDFIVVVGPSGSGKSTLLHLIGCVDRPTIGTIKIDNLEVFKLKEREISQLRNEKIGFVFQQFFLIPTLTALENVMLPALFNSKNNRNKVIESAKRLLTLVGLNNRFYHFPLQLSGGEMQRVAIARALINEPQILLADEPTGNLDSNNAKIIIDIFKKLNENGLTVIMATHNTELAREFRNIINLKEGVITN